MSTSPVVPTAVTNDTDQTRASLKQRRTRNKIQKQFGNNNDKKQSIRNLCNDDYQSTQWKSEAQQQVYRSKLLHALRQRSVTGTGTVTGAGTVIRETADRVLAVTAKGRTRWSRAILTNKLKLKFLNRNRRERGLIVTGTGNSRLRKPKVRVLKLKRKKLLVVNKNLPAVQRKTRVLGGLVPGCKKQPLPVVLKEATDYIPALEMQVKAMAALVELLSGGSGSGAGAGAGAGDLGRLSFSRSPPCV